MRRLADLECYLLSGVDANGTVAAEFAAVFGASDDLKQSEFPKGGAEAITVSIPNHHVPPLRLPILVPEGTITSALTVCPYIAIYKTDTFFFIASACWSITSKALRAL